MKKLKVVLIMALAFCLMLAFTGCSFIRTIKLSADDFYDDEKKIASGLNSFSIGNITQSKDDHSLEASIGEMSGMDTIWEYETSADESVSLNCTLEVNSGKAKLVLISPDKTVTALIEVDKNSEVTEYKTDSLPIKQGNNRIKLVTLKDTQLDVHIEIPNGEFDNLGLADDFMK